MNGWYRTRFNVETLGDPLKEVLHALPKSERDHRVVDMMIKAVYCKRNICGRCLISVSTRLTTPVEDQVSFEEPVKRRAMVFPLG